MRESDINEMLEDICRNMDYIYEKKNLAIEDKNIKELAKPQIKSILCHLRSILDYIAMDIYETIYKDKPPKNDIYFPYGNTFHAFNENVGRNFHKMSKRNKKVYNLIKSIQPFVTGDDWVVRLCKINNINKHNQLSAQERIDGTELHFEDNFIHISDFNDSTNLFIKNCVVNGKKQASDILITNGMIITDEKNNFDISINKWTEFYFESTNIDILEYLVKAQENIVQFKTRVYEELKNYTI